MLGSFPRIEGSTVVLNPRVEATRREDYASDDDTGLMTTSSTSTLLSRREDSDKVANSISYRDVGDGSVGANSGLHVHNGLNNRGHRDDAPGSRVRNQSINNRGDRDRAPCLHVQLLGNYVQDECVDEDVSGYAGLAMDDDGTTTYVDAWLPQSVLPCHIGEESETIGFCAALQMAPPMAQDKLHRASAETMRRGTWRLTLARPLTLVEPA